MTLFNKDYNALNKKYNTLVIKYEDLKEKVKSDLYKTIIDGDIDLKYENDMLREQNKQLRIENRELKRKFKTEALAKYKKGSK